MVFPFGSAILLLAASVLLAFPEHVRGQEGGPPEAEKKSRAFIGGGIAVGLEADSSEANLALRFGSIRRLGDGFYVGWDAAVHDLYSAGDAVYGEALVLFRLGATVEYLPPFPRESRPYLSGGAGWTSWGRRGGCGDWVCWPWRDSVRRDAFAGWVGAGVRIPRDWGRDLSIEAQIHPWSTWEGAWRFLNVYVTIGW